MSPLLMPLMTSLAPQLAPQLLNMGERQVNSFQHKYMDPVVQPGLHALGQGVGGLIQKLLPQPTRPFSY